MPSPLLRQLSLTPEGPLPADKLPSGLQVSVPREGGPIAWEWRVVFVDQHGAEVPGGTAEVTWYSVEILDPVLNTALKTGPYAYRTQPSVRTQQLGEPVEATAGQTYHGAIFNKGYPWPRVTSMTPPEVAPKVIRVTVGGAGDGDYSITINEGTPLTYAASEKTAEEIRDELVALFAAHDLVTATADDVEVDEFVIGAIDPGVDFAVALASPDDVMTQAEESPLAELPAGVRLYMIVAGSAALPPAG